MNKFLFILLFTLSLAVFLFLKCESTSVKKNEKYKKQVTLQDYEKNTLWQEQAQFIEEKLKIPVTQEENLIYLKALSDNEAIVVEQALENISKYKIEKYKKQVILLLRHRSPKIRWQALNALVQFNKADVDVKFIAKLINDSDWLVREKALKMIRNYPKEKEKKNYYYTIIMLLSDKNPNVLKQIYETLGWYENPSSFSYLLKRSYFAKNTVEILLIMRELSKYKNHKVEWRLKKLAKSHSKAIIRNEAKKLLKTFE